MIKKLGYILLDTSQLIDIIKRRKVLELVTPDFYNTYGLPFITIHQIIELAKYGNYDRFLSDIKYLSQIKLIFTASPFNNHIPIHIFYMFCWELSLLSQGILSINEIVSKFQDIIRPTFITTNPTELRLFFEFAQKSNQSSGIYTVPLSDWTGYTEKGDTHG